MGYKVLATASPHNHAKLKSLGASSTLDYSDPGLVAAIKSITGDALSLALDCRSEGGSVDKCIDAMGSAGGRVNTILNQGKEVTGRREGVEVVTTLMYTLFGIVSSIFPLAPTQSDSTRVEGTSARLRPIRRTST